MAALDHEQEDAVRAGLVVALACHGTRVGALEATARERAGRSVEAAGALEPIGGVVGLLLLDPDYCLVHHRQALEAALRFPTNDAPYVLLQKFPWSNGRAVDLVADALARANLPEEVVVEMLMDALFDWASRGNERECEVEWDELDLIAMRLLYRAFRDHLGRHDYIQRGDLSELQLSILARLTPLRIEGEVFDGYGFRNLPRDVNRLLGVGFGGLDQVLDGVWDRQSVRWPLWKWWHQAALVDRWDDSSKATTARDYVLAKMRRELTPSALFVAAQDAASGAYDVPHAQFVRLVAAVAEHVRGSLEQYVAAIGPEPNGAQAALALIPALTIATTQYLPGLEQILRWIDRITPADLKTEAIELARRS
jgi:hypothetical protein